ncbi:MAG: efflux RND transporter periplasmic adaptor subunit [Candidatus Magnetoovum sp. WYHC-5]|nr:efflux RND transporter periplasmic adaptor subunit [Candidatus Magnetoovum sp. WYHC-5]
MKKIFFLILIAVFVLGCKDEKTEPNNRIIKYPVVKGVKVQVVTRSLVDEYYETSATVMAQNTAVITTKIMGHIKAVYVKEGDKVDKGQLLIQIDDTEFLENLKESEHTYEKAAANVETAKENKAKAEKMYKRIKNLFDKKRITHDVYDNALIKMNETELDFRRAQSAIESAKAAQKEALLHVGYTKLIAPFDGIISKNSAYIGISVEPDMPLIEIEKPGNYYVNMNLDAKLFTQIYKGLEVNIAVDSIDRINTTGIITEIIPKVDPVSHTFPTKIEINKQGIRGGLRTLVSVPLKKRDILLAPAKAIIEKHQITGVYIVADKGIVKYTIIKIGKRYDDYVEVLSGLQEGDNIIIEGVVNVVDGGILEGIDERYKGRNN